MSTQDQFRMGCEALKRKAYAQSLVHFDAAAAAKPNDPRIEAHRAWAKFQTISHGGVKETDRWLGGVAKQNCRAVLEKIVAADASFADAWVFLGRMQLASGDAKDAVRSFQRALRANRDHGDAQRFLALARVDAPGTGLVEGVRQWIGARLAKKEDKAIKPIRVENIRRPNGFN